MSPTVIDTEVNTMNQEPNIPAKAARRDATVASHRLRATTGSARPPWATPTLRRHVATRTEYMIGTMTDATHSTGGFLAHCHRTTSILCHARPKGGRLRLACTRKTTARVRLPHSARTTGRPSHLQEAPPPAPARLHWVAPTGRRPQHEIDGQPAGTSLAECSKPARGQRHHRRTYRPTRMLSAPCS